MMVLSDGTNVPGPGSRRTRVKPDSEEQTPPPATVDGMPEGHEEQLAWVRAAEDRDTAAARANTVWAAADESALPPEQREHLAAQLREAVQGDPQAAEDPAGAPESTEAAPEAVDPADGAQGTDTGEVTQPGESLPTTEQEGGEPLHTETDDAGESSA